MGHRNDLQAEIAEMKRMLTDKKDKCWRTYCEDSGLQSPWEVVRRARDPWHVHEKMGRLRGRNGVLLDSEEHMVRSLVSELFGAITVEPEPWALGEGMGTCPLTKEHLQGAVRCAPGKTKNGLAPGPHGIDYRLIKAVGDTSLVRELIEEVVDCLYDGVIPRPWREMRVVFKPKPGRDFMAVKNCRPLNLINCVWRLRDKVVADRIQDFSGEVFHCLQYGSVRRQSAVDLLYKSVRRACKSIHGGGSVGWEF